MSHVVSLLLFGNPGRASVSFLTRYDEELMEPLVQCQVCQVSMHVARGSVSWLSSHGKMSVTDCNIQWIHKAMKRGSWVFQIKSCLYGNFGWITRT